MYKQTLSIILGLFVSGTLAAETRPIYGADYIKTYLKGMILSLFALPNHSVDVQQRIKKFVDNMLVETVHTRNSYAGSFDKDQMREMAQKQTRAHIMAEAENFARAVIERTYVQRYSLTQTQAALLVALVLCAFDAQLPESTNGCFGRYGGLSDYMGRNLEYRICTIIERAQQKRLLHENVKRLMS